MTPRQATVLLVFTLVTVVAAAAVPVVHAQDAPAGKVRTVTVAPEENNDKCPKGEGPCWDVATFVVVPGDHVSAQVDLRAAGVPHDFRVKLPDGEKFAPAKPGSGDLVLLNFTFPEGSKSVDYYCSVHPKTMVGKFVIASELGTTEAPAVPELGVHFLSYWVGLIAFMLLFVVYGATFFLFKYNETPETTDQWERAGEGAPDSRRRFSAGMASILAILLSAVAIAAVIYLARR